MARSIGDVDFDLLRGRVPGLKARLDIWEVFGLDGVGVEIGGNASGEFTMTSATYFNGNGFDVAAEQFIADCEKLQGQIISVSDKFGNIYDGVLIVEAMTEDDGVKMPCVKDGLLGVRVGIPFKCRRQPS